MENATEKFREGRPNFREDIKLFIGLPKQPLLQLSPPVRFNNVVVLNSLNRHKTRTDAVWCYLRTGARFSKVPVTLRARNQIFKSKYKE